MKTSTRKPNALNFDMASSTRVTRSFQDFQDQQQYFLPQKADHPQDVPITPPLRPTLQPSPTASSTANPVPATSTSFPFFRLPTELRDQIYAYASLTEDVWIGRLSHSNKEAEDVIVEKDSVYKPTTLIRTKHSIISVCRETRAAFRSAVWRDYMTGNRQIHLRVYDFSPKPLEALFASCSESEVQRLRGLQKCRVHHHLTPAFHAYRRHDRAYWVIVDIIDAWLGFAAIVFPFVEQSFDKCDWYDARLLRTTMEEDNISHIRNWENRWGSRVFLELWEVVEETYEALSEARGAGRNAFQKLAPLGQ